MYHTARQEVGWIGNHHWNRVYRAGRHGRAVLEGSRIGKSSGRAHCIICSDVRCLGIRRT